MSVTESYLLPLLAVDARPRLAEVVAASDHASTHQAQRRHPEDLEEPRPLFYFKEIERDHKLHSLSLRFRMSVTENYLLPSLAVDARPRPAEVVTAIDLAYAHQTQ